MNNPSNITFVNFINSEIYKIFRGLRKVAKNDCLSVRPSAWNNSASNGQIFIKFDICGI